jgi:hypothetical protein
VRIVIPSPASLSAGELSLQQKQIVTSPAKKGTYGMIGTNIGSNGDATNPTLLLHPLRKRLPAVSNGCCGLGDG